MFEIQFDLYSESDDKGIETEKNVTVKANGLDKVEFFVSTNPGASFKPLAKIASGGELSRIMLAIKTAMAEKDQIGVLVFDEIDIGISGRIAEAVGKKLKELSKSHQIITNKILAFKLGLSSLNAPIRFFNRNLRQFESYVKLGRLKNVIAYELTNEGRMVASLFEYFKNYYSKNYES